MNKSKSKITTDKDCLESAENNALGTESIHRLISSILMKHLSDEIQNPTFSCIEADRMKQLLCSSVLLGSESKCQQFEA